MLLDLHEVYQIKHELSFFVFPIHLFGGQKFITENEYRKNELPGEITEEGGSVFDVYCTDADGSCITFRRLT